MPLGNRGRKILIIAGCTAAGLLLLVLALPLWFPWVLRPVLSRAGASFSRYHRDDYSRFTLFSFDYRNATERVHANKVTVVVPTVWWWRLKVAPPAQPEPFLQIAGWTYQSLPSTNPAASVTGEFVKLSGELGALNRWLPDAVLTNGAIQVQARKVAVPFLALRLGALQGEAIPPRAMPPVRFIANVKRVPYQIRLSSEPLHLESSIMAGTNTVGLDIQATNWWWSNPVRIAAQFGPSGQWPQSARLEASHVQLPAQAVGLEPYAELTGGVTGVWSHAEFSLALNAAAHPQTGWTHLPPLSLDFRAQGDTNAFTIQKATVSSPWLSAELSRYVEVHLTGPILRQPATLAISADLSRQHWIPLTGQLQGEAWFAPSTGKLPVTLFQLSGSDIGTRSLRATKSLVNGTVEWPKVDITSAEATFSDGSTGALSGQIDVAQSLISGGHLTFKGPLPGRWLPKGYSLRDASMTAEFSGSIHQPFHHGTFHISSFSAPDLKPLQCDARWTGQGFRLDDLRLDATNAKSSLALEASLLADPIQPQLRVMSLTVRTNAEPALALAEPCDLSLTRTGSTRQFRALLSPLKLSGPAGQLQARADLVWPAQGDLFASAQGISTSFLNDFLETNLPDVQIRHFATSSAWSNGPARFQVELSARGVLPFKDQLSATPSTKGEGAIAPTQALAVSADLDAVGNEKGLSISNLTLKAAGSVVLSARGFLPMEVVPGSSAGLIQLHTEAPLELTAVTEPQSVLWKEMRAYTGISLVGPELNLNVAGTWAEPKGELRVTAQEVGLAKATARIPAIDNLKLDIEFSQKMLRLRQGELLVQGQSVNFTGEVPLGEDFWRQLRQEKRFPWERASVQVEIEHAELAAFEPLFPTVLAPQGYLHAGVTLSPGGKLGGELALLNARTRPLGNFGPIRNINLRMGFAGRELELRKVSAEISGSPLSITGRADLHGRKWLSGVLPPFQLSIKGTDVPLARQADFIVRSDLALRVVKTNGAPPLISGAVHLRDSFFLSDLGLLAPGRVAAPAQRPPYFSIADPELASWRLMVNVDGVRFLKVNTPVFNGQGSCNLKLQGTLKDPIALGDVFIDSGVVQFPFASFQVQQGLVTLSSQDPYRPQLSVNASSRQFGYDLRLSVTGPADTPNIQFSSNPPLSSQEILLMVTAGQMPQGTFTLTPQQRAQTVALFLGRDLLSKLGLGEMGQQRLIIRSGEDVSEQGRPTYNVEFKLTKRWSLVGEYDRFGDYDAGVKWQIYSK